MPKKRGRRSDSSQSGWLNRQEGSRAAQVRERRRLHWKIVAGAPIRCEDMPLALLTAKELSDRLRRGIFLGVMFGIIIAIYVPQFLPPEDAFSSALLIATCLAILTYLFGVLVVLRARWWLHRHRRSN